MPAGEITPFEIKVPAAALEDLDRRLRNTRLPGAPAAPGWRYGADPDYMARLLDYWLDGYDWRKAEADLNRFPQFTAPVESDDGACLKLHFIHEKAAGGGRPLLLLHGWPGSTFEFQALVEPLAHPERFGGAPEDAFDVVVPSLPGYGFSEAPTAPLGPRAIAALMRRLMAQVLGYERFFVQGGDWGALIAAWLGLDHAPPVAALHLNMATLRPAPGEAAPVTAAEEAWIQAARKHLKTETAYQDVHATKSQSLAYGLTDSPLGLAAWIVEKFQAWNDRGLDEPNFDFDQLLTNVMIYWLTGAINSSTWLYRAARETGELVAPAGRRIEVPTAYLLPPHDLVPPPPTSWLERIGPVSRRTDLASGGHFVALENGPALLDDVRDFFREQGGQ